MITLCFSLFMGFFVAYLAVATIYLVVLALASLLLREHPQRSADRYRKFAVLIPAHNEELLISRLLESLVAMGYPADCRDIFVIADNCSDNTSGEASRYPVTLLTRTDCTERGKGFALRYALQNIEIESYDAVLIIDADSVVDPRILLELNQSLSRDERAIQCHNGVANRHDSWFTELLYVSRTISNRLYHHGKHKLGLSSYLMGNGICLDTKLLRDNGWNAFSLGEDWEYSALLAGRGIRIGFAINARVYHQESRSLDQATSQRLRWAKGRFEMGRKLGLRLFFTGLYRRNRLMVDSSLPFIFPNYSLLVNLILLALLLSLFIPASFGGKAFIAASLSLLVCQLALFATGMVLVGQFHRSLAALLRAPIFLVWKSVIDVLSITGPHRDDEWVRTRRA